MKHKLNIIITEVLFMKTRLGVSTGILAAATFFLGLFGGYTVSALLVGYILLFEQDSWLKKTAVKSIAIMLIFSAAYYIADLIPGLLDMVSNLFSVFKSHFYPNEVHSFFSFVKSGITLLKEIIMIMLGFLALKQKTINMKSVDNLMD